MLVTYTTSQDAAGICTVTLAAVAGKITRVFYVQGIRPDPLVLNSTANPLIRLVNIANSDGTTFSPFFTPEEEGGGGGSGLRRSRCVVVDPPYPFTGMPNAAVAIGYEGGAVTSGVSPTLTVHYRYE